MQWAALIAWIVTALGGSVLFLAWLRSGGLHQNEGIRAPRLLSHISLAVTGLIVWAAYLASDNGTLAWVAVAILVAVALLGFSMLLIWVRGRTTTIRTETPAEGSFPLPVVALHGLLGATTLILSALAAAGIGT
jgi:hypothetical protein